MPTVGKCEINKNEMCIEKCSGKYSLGPRPTNRSIRLNIKNIKKKIVRTLFAPVVATTSFNFILWYFCSDFRLLAFKHSSSAVKMVFGCNFCMFYWSEYVRACECEWKSKGTVKSEISDFISLSLYCSAAAAATTIYYCFSSASTIFMIWLPYSHLLYIYSAYKNVQCYCLYSATLTTTQTSQILDFSIHILFLFSQLL